MSFVFWTRRDRSTQQAPWLVQTVWIPYCSDGFRRARLSSRNPRVDYLSKVRRGSGEGYGEVVFAVPDIEAEYEGLRQTNFSWLDSCVGLIEGGAVIMLLRKGALGLFHKIREGK